MAHALTETPAEGTSVTVPDAGDARTAASVETPFQACANRIKYCENHIDTLEARTTASYSADRVHPVLLPFDPSHWLFTGGGGIVDTTSAQTLYIRLLDLPEGSTLVQASVALAGGTGHGALPANKPTAKLMKLQFASGSAPTTVHALVTDAPANVGAYEVAHVLGPSGGLGPTFGSMTEVVDASYIYWIEVTTESGANATINGAYQGAFTRCTVTTQNVG